MGALLARGVEVKLLCRDGVSSGTVRMPRRRMMERVFGGFTKRLGLNELHLVGSHDVKRLVGVKEADVLDSTVSMAAPSAIEPPRADQRKTHGLHVSRHMAPDRALSREPGLRALEIGICRDARASMWSLPSVATPPHWNGGSSVRRFAGRDSPSSHRAVGWRIGWGKACWRIMLRFTSPMAWISMFSGRFPGTKAGRCWGIAPEAVLLLVAIDNMDRPLKGGDLLKRALEELPEDLRRRGLLLLLGRSSPGFRNDLALPVLDLGYVSHDSLKALACSAADLTVNPTRAESFGLVCLESLAEPDNSSSLARVVVELLADKPCLVEMKGRARRLALERHSLELQAKRYIELYQSISASI